MTVARKLNRSHSLKADFVERPKCGWQVQVALAEHAVIVNTAGDVVEVNVNQVIRVLVNHSFDGKIVCAQAMANVEAESKRLSIRAQPILQLAKLARAFDEHSGFRLESDSDAVLCSAFENSLQPIAKSLPNLVAFRLRRSARPQRNDIRAESARHPNPAAKKFDTHFAFRNGFFQQSRSVLLTRIQQEARTRFDRKRDVEPLRQFTSRANFSFGNVKRIEVTHIERQRARVVAKFRDQLQRFRQAMVRESIRVVAESKHDSVSLLLVGLF